MMKNKKKKPVLGIFSLTCDDGCEVAILDQGEKLLSLLEEVKVGDFRMIEEEPEASHYDVALVEGGPLSKDNIKKLKKIREKSTYLVALGACAVIGGVPELKNYMDKDKAAKHVYDDISTIDNIDVKPLSYYVKVDYNIPGCPVDGNEVIKLLYDIKEGRFPEIPKRPVCYECQLSETECLLQANEKTGRKAQVCMGPISLGGCNAVCPKAGYPCDGCRGVFEGAEIENYEEAMLKISSKEDLKNLFERYGNYDKLQELKQKLSKKKD